MLRSARDEAFATYLQEHYPQFENSVQFWLGAADFDEGRARWACPYGTFGYGASAWDAGWLAAERFASRC
jgi:hypothetical protein